MPEIVVDSLYQNIHDDPRWNPNTIWCTKGAMHPLDWLIVLLLNGAVIAYGIYLARGTTRTIATNWLIWALSLVGISPHRLAKLYRHVR